MLLFYWYLATEQFYVTSKLPYVSVYLYLSLEVGMGMGDLLTAVLLNR